MGCKEHTIVLDEQWFDQSSVKKRSSIHHYAWLRFGKSFSCSSNFWLQLCYVSFSGINSKLRESSWAEFFLKTIKGPWLLAVFAKDSVLVIWMGFVCSSSLWLFVFMKFISLTISRYFDHATPFLLSSSNFASVDESFVEL